MKQLVSAGVAAVALAFGTAGVKAQEQRVVDTDRVLGSEAFLSAHPDLQNRHRGTLAYEEGRLEEATSCCGSCSSACRWRSSR